MCLEYARQCWCAGTTCLEPQIAQAHRRPAPLRARLPGFAAARYRLRPPRAVHVVHAARRAPTAIRSVPDASRRPGAERGRRALLLESRPHAERFRLAFLGVLAGVVAR